MTPYLLIILSFFATAVGVFGDTTNPKEKGLKRLNALGYITLVIAFFVFIVAARSIHEENKEKEIRTEYAIKELELTLRNIHIQVHNCLYNRGDLEANLNDLDDMGHDLEETLAFYQNVLSSETNSRVRYLKYVLTDKRYWKTNPEHMLWNLENNLSSLSKLIKTDSLEPHPQFNGDNISD